MKKFNLYASSVLFTFFIVGCVVGPRFSSPKIDSPPSYIYGDSMNVDTLVGMQWWHSFGDPTLDSLIERAMDSSLNLRQVATRVQQSRLKMLSARAALWPTLALDASASFKGGSNSKPTSGYSASLAIGWDLDFWGRSRLLADAASSTYRATEADYSAVMLSLCAQVATTYFSILQYEQSLNIATSTYASRIESLKLMDSMYFYGMTSGVDLQQAEASAYVARSAVEQYRRAAHQSLLALNVLLSENPTPMLHPPFSRTNVEFPDAPCCIPEGLPSDLLERRPDIIQAYWQYKAAFDQIGVAVANRLPSISIGGSGGIAGAFTGGIVPLAWSTLGSLAMPILNWGTNKRNVEIARQGALAAQLGYRSAMISALSEVEQALVAIRTYELELQSAEQALQASEIAQKLTQELYNSGTVAYLDVLDADRTLFSAQITYAETHQAYLSSFVALYKALGGGYSSTY